VRDWSEQVFDDRERGRAMRVLEDLSDERFDLEQELNRILRRIEDIRLEEQEWRQHYIAHGGREEELY
jgi:hypothetical protein